METKYSRICWNTSGWRQPTGEARRMETAGSYVSEHGFGHEEWLFRFEWMLAAPGRASKHRYRYAHLQTVRRDYDTCAGNTFRILLYALDSGKKRLFVGSIDNCYVPTVDELKQVHNEYKARGWLSEMSTDLARIGVDAGPLVTEVAADIIDIRFRQSDVTRVEPWLEIPHDHKTYSINRYRLLNVDDKDSLASEIRRLNSVNVVPAIDPRRNENLRSRPSVDPVTYEPTHVRLQNRIYDYLVAKYGKDAVSYEEKNVDLSVKFPAVTILIEIKTENIARLCIRAALGQILEYAYYQQERDSLKNPPPEAVDLGSL